MSDTFVNHATLYFLARNPLYSSEKPYTIPYFPHGDIPQNNIQQEAVHEIPVQDVRTLKQALEFERDGFVVMDLESRLQKEEFADPERMTTVYLEEVKELLQQLLGTRNIAIVEYLVRRRHASFPISTGEEFEYAQPVATAHVDFSPDCIAAMIEDRYAHRAVDLLKHRHRIVNIWKPLNGPLHDWPLALCKPSSLDPTHDRQTMDRVYPTNIEESIQIHYSESQEWCYLSGQRNNEVWVFRGGDSEIGMNAGAPHCSFENKQAVEGIIRPRESVEVRALVFDADEDLILDSVSTSRRHGPKATFQQQQRMPSQP